MQSAEKPFMAEAPLVDALKAPYATGLPTSAFKKVLHGRRTPGSKADCEWCPLLERLL